jgi:hypothetical protein
MAPSLKLHGQLPNSGWDIYSVYVPTPAKLPVAMPPAVRHFVCLLLWDADKAETETIVKTAERLLALGGVYFCCCDKDGERTRQIFEDVAAGKLGSGHVWPNIVVISQSASALTDAFEFCTDTALPEKAYMPTCNAVVCIAVGNELASAFIDCAVAIKLAQPPPNPPHGHAAALRQSR